ncbi:extracellular solute-binding protein [Paenibacillus koleovorans]|uniref:extracellular solute-binding protein n=1 Tax=Paenibacillus koleovorans TaxID=121608 RepID=UPI000FD90350|nr:extracellular solute-binding protein [Paenibacillus koleovorans]
MRHKVKMAAALVLMTSMIAACSSGSGSTKENASANPSPSAAATQGPPTDLSMIVQSHTAFPQKTDWIIYQELGKLTNTNLKPSAYQGNWWEAIPLVIASGNMPDLMWISGTDNLHKYGGEGAFVNLLDHMDKMPNMKAWIAKNQFEYKNLLSADGKLFMNPTKGGYGNYDGLWLHREDIFKKHNLAVPTTYDELYTTMVKLKELYPDSYPLYAPSWGIMNQIALSFGSANAFYINSKTNKWTYGPSEDSYRKGVEFLAKAYKEKLIPQEFGNVTNAKRDELITGDKTFIYFGYINQIDSFNNLARPKNANFKLSHFTPPGGAGAKGYHGFEFIQMEGLAVTTTSKNKDAAFRYLDTLFTDKAQEIVSWGKEGVTYEKPGGVKKYLPAVKDTNTRSIEFGLRTAGTYALFDNTANISLFNEETKASYEAAAKHIAPAIATVVLKKEERDSIQLKQDAIGKYVSEQISKFILGTQPMSDWDKYITGLNQLGLSDVLKVFETAYARSK